MKAHADFWQVTGDALDYAMESCGIEDSRLRKQLLGAYLELDCYADVKPILSTLKRKRLPTATMLTDSSFYSLEARYCLASWSPGDWLVSSQILSRCL